MTSKGWLYATCVAGCAMVVPVLARAQLVAGSVENGLQGLAQEIVAKSVAQDRNSIAVLPFPNADGSCSVLSTYIADELIEALFSTQNSPLTIVERNQLEAIVNEIQIGAGGLLNPETTQSLGKVSGVKALTVGTITQIGDRVRITARLVATDTGRTISAAAVSIPRTNDIDSLLRQPIAGEGGTCGVRIVSHTRPSAGTEPFASPALNVPPTSISVDSAQALRSATLEGLQFFAQTVSLSADKKTVSIVLKVTNVSKTPIRAMLVGPKPTVIDDMANLAEASEASGIQVCSPFNTPFYNENPQVCANMARSGWTILSPNFPAAVLFRFKTETSFTGKSFSFASALVIEEVNEKNKSPLPENHDVKRISLSLANLRIGEAR